MRVKICGVTNADDARIAEEAGADYVGFVLTTGFARSLALTEAPHVAAATGLPRVAVVVDESPEEAARRADAIDAAVVQLHGNEDADHVAALRRLGDWAVWKAVRARAPEEVRAAVAALADLVDGFLVEGWREGVVGGGGVALAVEPAAVRAAVPGSHDFVMAGGLTPEGVAAAVARFTPDVVDVSSGVERTVGHKDAARVHAFVRSVRDAAPGTT